eukprot:1392552-Amorphochlora_amoeboformis.AAC.2
MSEKIDAKSLSDGCCVVMCNPFDSADQKTGTWKVKDGFAKMFKGGVIMGTPSRASSPPPFVVVDDITPHIPL